MSDVTFDMTTYSRQMHQKYAEPWRVTLMDMGKHTMTGWPSTSRTAVLLHVWHDIAGVDIGASIDVR